MRNSVIVATMLLCVLGFFSCEKDKAAQVREITYEVILVDATAWSGFYIDQKGSFTHVNNVRVKDWRVSFKDLYGLDGAGISALVDASQYYGPNADAVMNIYINGVLYATSGKNSRTSLLTVMF